jgi:hypothetical protein
MASNQTPRELRTQRPPRNVARTVGIVLLILLGAYVLMQYLLDESDPDRPPIIISSGSVYVDVQGGDWEDKGGKGYKHDFKGKSVKSFTASTGIGINGSACSVDGKTIVVTYGSTEITFSRKGKTLGFGKNHAFAQFAGGADVSHPSMGRLMVNTGDTLVSFRNENGDNCAVAGGRLEILQKH